MTTPMPEEKESWMKAMLKAVINIKLFSKYSDDEADGIGHDMHNNIKQILQFGFDYI